MLRKKFSLPLLGLLLALQPTTNVFSQSKGKSPKSKQKTEELRPWEVDTLINSVPINRQIFSDRIQKGLMSIDKRDGVLNKHIHLSDSLVSQSLSNIFFQRIPLLAIHIENLDENNQVKIGYYQALDNMLRRVSNIPFDTKHVEEIRNTVLNFDHLFTAIQTDSVHEFVQNNANLYTLNNSMLLDNYPEEKSFVFTQVGKAEPAMMLKRLGEFPNEPYADTIVAAAAKVVPSKVLNFATSTSILSSVVRRNQDPLVQTIVKIADQSKNPNKVLPFIGLIYHGKMTVVEAENVTGDPVAYYKALVQAELDNDHLGQDALDKEVEYRGLQIVRVVNSLHEKPNAVRFASIMQYNAPELYFMLIGSQDEIYTSSFVFMANRLIDELGKDESGARFLDTVHNYRFRTWIRMSAGYNTLSKFLGTMSESEKTTLMKAFVANLEKGGPDDLEDAVDVADAFGSIKDPKLMSFLEKEVVANYKRTSNDEKGTFIYGLLSTIMKGASDSKGLTQKLSIIPPITYVPYKELVDTNKDDKAVVVQTFFYGDEDGRSSFASFQSNFKDPGWKKTSNQYWVKYSYGGKYPVDVYANFPGDENKNEDFEAQQKLNEYFVENDINPTVVIHRGHSYHLDGSLTHLNDEVKVVMLGSCGGYHNLSKILDKSPDANIISSKQTGAMAVNEPIIRILLKQMTEGKDIDWIQSWNDLSGYFKTQSATVQDLFSDYIPPNQNLGAIFIKAYRKLQLQAMEM